MITIKKFNITGMTCAACSSRVEKAVSRLSSVEKCSVNLLTNSMTVSGNATESEIISAVKKVGYGASPFGKRVEETPQNSEIKTLKIRLVSSIGFLLALLYFSMGKMLNFPLPDDFINGIIQLVLAAPVLIINRRFFINGVKGILNRSPNMDTLVSLGSGIAFLYSIYALFKNKNLYFESSAMILTLITVGKLLEAISKGKTTNAIKGLMGLSPQIAIALRNGEEIEIPISELKRGEIFVVYPGAKIPTDGKIISGKSSVDESALTGESTPADKEEGSDVFAGTLNLFGFITCEATKVGEETTLSQIIKTVSDASSSKAPIAKIADRVSGVFVPVVMLLSLITTLSWLLLGSPFEYALSRAISVLVISCPCALGLATPVAIMVGSGVGAKNGVLFKTATSLEETGKTKIVVFDKTGTLTKGKPAVTDILPCDMTENEFLTLAASLEKKSEHPLARAILNRAENLSLSEVENFENLSGNGVFATLNNEAMYGGKTEFIKTKCNLSSQILKKAEALSEEGKTPLLFCKNGEFIGIIAVADTLKEDSAEVVSELSKMKIKTVMLTGDNEKTARAIAKKAKVDDVIAGVLPNEKVKKIRLLKKEGRVLMVGDGINDAPALTEADIGIAMGKGTDIAIDSADVVLSGESLSGVATAIKLSRKTLRTIKQNLFWAFFYNAIGIPLAAGIFGWGISPMFSAGAMSLSSIFVVSNALRLNFFKDKKEIKKMKVKIDGMMCKHCKMHVEKALSALGGIESFEVSLENNEAIIKGSASKEAVTAAITEAGYTVTEIE